MIRPFLLGIDGASRGLLVLQDACPASETLRQPGTGFPLTSTVGPQIVDCQQFFKGNLRIIPNSGGVTSDLKNIAVNC